VSGVTAGLAQRNPVDGGPAAIYVDELFRPAPNVAAANAPAAAPTASQTAATAADRAEVSRLLLHSFRGRSDVPPADRAYLVQTVAAHTGLSQGDADKRVTEVLTQAK